MSRCPEGHKCIWCGPKVAADRRDARGPQIDDWDDYSTREEQAMATVDEDRLQHAGHLLAEGVIRRVSRAPTESVLPIFKYCLGIMIAGYAFMRKIELDEAWVELRERAIAEQVAYETTIKPIIESIKQGTS